MSTIIRGTTDPQLQRETWDYDPTRGWVHQLEYRGASQAKMALLQQQYAAQGIACRLVNNQGDTAGLDVNDSSLSYTIDSWELVGNDEGRDLFTHPAMLYILDGDSISYLRKQLDANAAASSLDLTGFSSGQQSLIKRFYSLYQCGTQEFRRSQYVLRHKTNAPSRYSVNVADVGVECIYTPAQLLSEACDPGLWIYPLPGRLQYKISHIPALGPVANYQWGWLKSTSTETTAANNRIDITTEYILELWSTDLYSPF